MPDQPEPIYGPANQGELIQLPDPAPRTEPAGNEARALIDRGFRVLALWGALTKKAPFIAELNGHPVYCVQAPIPAPLAESASEFIAFKRGTRFSSNGAADLKLSECDPEAGFTFKAGRLLFQAQTGGLALTRAIIRKRAGLLHPSVQREGLFLAEARIDLVDPRFRRTRSKALQPCVDMARIAIAAALDGLSTQGAMSSHDVLDWKWVLFGPQPVTSIKLGNNVVLSNPTRLAPGLSITVGTPDFVVRSTLGMNGDPLGSDFTTRQSDGSEYADLQRFDGRLMLESGLAFHEDILRTLGLDPSKAPGKRLPKWRFEQPEPPRPPLILPRT